MRELDRLRELRPALDELRAAQPPVARATVERLVAIAQRGGRHRGLDELVESWRAGTTTWSVLRAHPRIIAAQQVRAEELLAAVRRAREREG